MKLLFFEEVLERIPEIGLLLLSTISECSLVAKTPFQRCEALRLMSFILKHNTTQHNATGDDGRDDVVGCVVVAVEGVLKEAAAGGGEEKKGLLKASRIRIVLQLCNDVARWLRKNNRDYR